MNNNDLVDTIDIVAFRAVAGGGIFVLLSLISLFVSLIFNWPLTFFCILLTGGIGILISLATIVLIGYTIRLAMYSRKEKIKTMRLVGATAWLIGAPYVIEGALQGLLSGVLAAGAVYLLFDQLLFNYEPDIYKVLEPSALLIYPSTVLLGLVLGILGSTLSVSKYLRAASKR